MTMGGCMKYICHNIEDALHLDACVDGLSLCKIQKVVVTKYKVFLSKRFNLN